MYSQVTVKWMPNACHYNQAVDNIKLQALFDMWIKS